MSRRIRSHARHNAVAYLALFVALGGTSAYAANEWTGANVQDETLTGADVRGTDGTSTTSGTNGSLTGADIAGQQAIPLRGQPFKTGSLTTWDVRDNTLTGDDILESSLAKVPDADKLGGVNASEFAHRLFVRATFYQAGTIYSQVGNGTIAYAGSPGDYTITFPQDVSHCAALATVNLGLNGG